MLRCEGLFYVSCVRTYSFPEGKRPMGRPRRGWEDNIKMDLQKGECGCVNWIGLAQDIDCWRALVNVVINLRVP
jgi:hypothetical protein